jgi:type II secretory pathway pseudopilin PulG
MKKSINLRNQKGIGLVETIVAVAILGTALIAFVVSLSVGSLAVNALDKETIAQSLAQTQMEYIKDCLYDPNAVTYPVLTPPATYSVTVDVSPVPGGDVNIQKITVTVYKDGVSLLTVYGYKVNR